MSADAEEILRRAACGELAHDAEELRALLAADPDARQRYEEHRALARALSTAGADERRALDAARAATTEADRQRVAAALRAGAPAIRAPRRWWQRPATWAAAAAIVLGIALGALALREPRQPQRTTLSTTGGGYECVEPVGAFSDDSVFRWRGERPASGAFVVVVCAEEAGTRGKVLMTSGRCTENEWKAPRERLATLPDSIVWFVRVIDGSGGSSTESPDARAQRSRP
jgi:hypothetical protein